MTWRVLLVPVGFLIGLLAGASVLPWWCAGLFVAYCLFEIVRCIVWLHRHPIYHRNRKDLP